MLTPDEIDVLPDPILELYERFHISILEDIARRIAGLSYDSAAWQAPAWQAQRLIESGLLYEEVIQRLSELTGQSEEVLRRIFEKAGVKAIRFDDKVYRAAGLKPLPLNMSPQMVELLRVGLEKTNGLLRNLTRSTAISAQELFFDATDLAYMQISTGTLDYNTAIREAVKEAAKKGLQVIYYESGHRDKVDVAARRAVLTGVNQTVGEMQLERARQMGTDLVQTTAHLGARDKGDVPENHELWQGKVFTLGTEPQNTQYPGFYEITGYGTVTGLMGVNCRHNFYPFFKGLSAEIYSDKDLQDLASRSVTYNGKELSWYEATQVQRKIEREIRQAKREAAAIEAVGLDAFKEKQRVRDLQAEMRDFLDQTGLRRQYPREQVIFSEDKEILDSKLTMEETKEKKERWMIVK